MENTVSLQGLQSEKQALVLDTVTQIRKCGLDSILSLPQLVVCGDQSAGKSSVLEALTEIPFPRADNLCTRFATEIILRRGNNDSITIKIIPDSQRHSKEQESIRSFSETISDFEDLPALIDKAKTIMGIGGLDVTRAFAKDILSIEIEGPDRPQLTVVDLPGLIQNETKGVTKDDVELVKQLTEDYIKQSRTICLAVVTATNDYANQGILGRVKEADPKGTRSLGIITKPDRLDAGSGSERAIISLARNEDIFFKLGWHVLRNRSFQDGETTFKARNQLEDIFFQTSNLKVLDKASVGIDNLRKRLSHLLFEHIQRELPKLNEELEEALANAKSELNTLGTSRSSAEECRAFLIERSMKFHEICLAAVEGRYNGAFFKIDNKEPFESSSPASLRRLRAMIQKLNTAFSEEMTDFGAKFAIISDDKSGEDETSERCGKLEIDELRFQTASTPTSEAPKLSHFSIDAPSSMTTSEATEWVKQAMERSRGRELTGNFNPLLVGELFWEQSSKWIKSASEYAEMVFELCTRFLQDVLQKLCPEDVKTRLWTSLLEEQIKGRSAQASLEIQKLDDDLSAYPINYNHYYTDTLQKLRQERDELELEEQVSRATHVGIDYYAQYHKGLNTKDQAGENAVASFRGLRKAIETNMERHTCQEVLDCLDSIYKVQLKTFIANVTTQVIERHVVRGLESIFSPMVVSAMSDEELQELASEPTAVVRQRKFLEDRIKKLENGRKVLRKVMHRGAI